MKKERILACKEELEDHLVHKLLPFWFDRCKDDQYGGFITHFDKDGKDTGEDEKSLIAQTRTVFTMASAHRAGYGDGRCLEYAKHGVDFLLNKMWDQEHGGFFFTADDHERLIHRPKPFGDDSMPAGNGVAAFALSRLGHLLGEQAYLDAAESTLNAAWQQIRRFPQAHCSLLDALDEYLYPTETIVIRGPGEQLERWRERAGRRYTPHRFSVAIPADETQLPGLLASRVATSGVAAYICSGTHCEAPVESFDAFDQRLTDSENAPAAQGTFDGGAGSFKRPRE